RRRDVEAGELHAVAGFQQDQPVRPDPAAVVQHPRAGRDEPSQRAQVRLLGRAHRKVGEVVKVSVGGEVELVIVTDALDLLLERVLDGYSEQDAPPGSFEVVVVADAAEPDLDTVDRLVADRPYPARRISGPTPGLSANRNAGWREAAAPVVMFTDNDTIPVER